MSALPYRNHNASKMDVNSRPALLKCSAGVPPAIDEFPPAGGTPAIQPRPIAPSIKSSPAPQKKKGAQASRLCMSLAPRSYRASLFLRTPRPHRRDACAPLLPSRATYTPRHSTPPKLKT
jgi:hypothetical protein